MRNRSNTIIAAGMLLALFGIAGVLAYGRRVEQRATGGGRIEAFTAARDIAAGTKGEEAGTALSKVALPRSVVPEGAIDAPSLLAGRIAVRPIAKGEVITGTQFGTQLASTGSGLQVPPGHNAIAMDQPVPQGVARYVQPGDLVNVFASFKEPVVTKLILSNVQVLANAPAEVSRSATTGAIVLTLALRPADAEKLVFAKENGSVWFGLVHPGDGPVSTGGQRADSVLR